MVRPITFDRWTMGKWAALAGIVTALCFADAGATELDINRPQSDVFRACKLVDRFMTSGVTEHQDVLDVGFCYGFISGLWSQSPACIGAQRTTDIVLVFNAFVEKNPVWRTRGPVPAFLAAMLDAFPCPKK